MEYPILSAWSDPAVTDADLLVKLSDIHADVAAGVVCNPNFPQDKLATTIASIPLSMERSEAIGQYAVKRLLVPQQITLLARASAKSATARAAVAGGMTDEALVTALRTDDRLNAEARAAVASVVFLAAENRPVADITDDLRNAVRVAVRSEDIDCAGRDKAVVRAWQTADPAVMTDLLAHAGLIVGTAATVGVPGLADQWFALGGWLRAAAAVDPDITVGPVLDWLPTATAADKDALIALCGNPRIPLEPLFDVVRRINQARWDARAEQDDRNIAAAAAISIGKALDVRVRLDFPALVEPVLTMRDGHAALVRKVAVADGLWTALVLGAHTPSAVRDTLLRSVQRHEARLTPLVAEVINDLAAKGALVNDEEALSAVNGYRSRIVEPTWRAARATAAAAFAATPTLKASIRLSRVSPLSTAAVHADAPHLAQQLTSAASWAKFFELIDNDQTFQEALGAVLAEQNAATRTKAMSSLLGNAFGDDD